MDFLYGYIVQIAVFIVFTAFLEVILPSGKYRKYIEIISGFILIIILITPIESIFADKEFSIDSFMLREDINLNKKIVENQEEKYTQKQKEAIANDFKEQIEKHIKSYLSTVCIVEYAKISLSDDFSIEGAEICVREKEKEKSFIRIEKNENIEEENLINNIKKTVSDFYNIRQDNINIIVQKS